MQSKYFKNKEKADFRRYIGEVHRDYYNDVGILKTFDDEIMMTKITEKLSIKELEFLRGLLRI